MHTTRRQPANDNARPWPARRPVEGQKRRGPRPFTDAPDAREAPPAEASHGAQTGAEGVAAPTAPTAPVHPSQSADDHGDATRRGVVRAILATLDGAALVAFVAALVSWCFALERASLVAKAHGEHLEAKRIAERAHRALAEVLTSTGTLQHATPVLFLLFGTSAGEVTRRAYTAGVGGETVGAALRDLREALEALAPPEAAAFVVDLLAVAFHPDTDHAAHLAALEVLFSTHSAGAPQ